MRTVRDTLLGGLALALVIKGVSLWMAVYSRTTWVDSPSTLTPEDSTRLNNMEAELVALDALLQGKISVIDTATGSKVIKVVQAFIGTTDPRTVSGISVANGDVWVSRA
jgi:hypothetical protein